MPLVLFENAFQGNPTNNLAISSEKVISVYQIKDPLDDKGLLTAIYLGPDLTFTVQDPMDQVLNKLNNPSIVTYTIAEKEPQPVKVIKTKKK